MNKSIATIIAMVIMVSSALAHDPQEKPYPKKFTSGEITSTGNLFSRDQLQVRPESDSTQVAQFSLFGDMENASSVINSFVGSDTKHNLLVFDRCRGAVSADTAGCTDLSSNDKVMEIRLKGYQNGTLYPFASMFGYVETANGTTLGGKWLFTTSNANDQNDAVVIDENQALHNISNKSQYEQISAILAWAKSYGGSLEMLNGWLTCHAETGASCSGTETDFSTAAGQQTITYTAMTSGENYYGSTMVLSPDGTDDYVTVSDSGDLDFLLADATINMWVEVTDTDATAILMSKYDANATLREWTFSQNSSEKISLYLTNETSGNITLGNTTAGLSTGWHMITLVIDATGCATNYDFTDDVFIFVDGVKVAMTAIFENMTCAEGFDATATDVLIGAHKETVIQDFYPGDIGIVFIDKGTAYSDQAVWELFMLTRSFYGI